MRVKIPKALKIEHEELHRELARLTKTRGKVGVAARGERASRARHPPHR